MRKIILFINLVFQVVRARSWVEVRIIGDRVGSGLGVGGSVLGLAICIHCPPKV